MKPVVPNLSTYQFVRLSQTQPPGEIAQVLPSMEEWWTILGERLFLTASLTGASPWHVVQTARMGFSDLPSTVLLVLQELFLPDGLQSRALLHSWSNRKPSSTRPVDCGRGPTRSSTSIGGWLPS